MYDPRFDFKQKWDCAVLIGGHRFGIDAFRGDESARVATKAWRDQNERTTKRNTSESSHWEHRDREGWIELSAAVTNEEYRVVNGVRLFTIAMVNDLLEQIYKTAGVTNGYRLTPSDQNPFDRGVSWISAKQQADVSRKPDC